MKNTILRTYQTEAVDKAICFYENEGRGFLIGDKCGLGKTVEALKIAEMLPKKYNLIGVIAPAFLAPVWRREIAARCDDGREYKFAIYSYSEISDTQVLLHAKSSKYDLIILDEIHWVKNYKAARTVATLGDHGIHKVADRLLGLSGTYPPNTVGDCYTWLNASDSPLAQNGFEMFCREFSASCHRNNFGLQVSGFKPNERWFRHFSPAYIGRNLDDVEKDIPNGLRVDFVVDIPTAIEKAEIKLFGRIIDDPDLIEKAVAAVPSFDQLTEFRKMQGIAKVRSVVDYTLEAWEEDEKKILIFAYHHEIADRIFLELTKKKLPCILITGTNTDPEARDAIINKSNKESERIIVATIDALKEGITATGFTLTLFAEIDWRAYALEQAEGRTRRLGQVRVVRWVYFAFNKGVDKMMRKKIDEKQKLAAAVRGTV